MKLLNGKELAEFIQERQAHEVRALRQAHGVVPKLAIIRTNPDPVVDSYMKLKQGYGQDILIEVDVHTVKQAEALGRINELNNDSAVHGIIVQIPLPDPSQTTEILNAVAPTKDVDGLRSDDAPWPLHSSAEQAGVVYGSGWDAPTPMAINWLLAGYNVNFAGKHIVIVGHGRLVGKPLAKLWQQSDYDVEVADKQTPNLAEVVRGADILVCATGTPGLITKDMIKPDAVIVDAGVATDRNGLVGDVVAGVREMPNITITPEKGGVGPLTVCALFDNVIRAARKVTQTTTD